MTVKRTINDLISYVNNVCNYVKSQGRDTVSVSDFTPDLSEIQYQSIHKRFIEEGIDINKIINNNGLNFQKRGIGYTHVFEDGEKVLSSYEYMFSNILRKNSL